MKRILAFLAVPALVAGTSDASAGVLLLSDPSGINATYSNDFETVASSGPVTFVSGQLYQASFANAGGTSSGAYGLGVFSPANIEANFSTPFTAIGMYFGNDDTCCTRNVDAILSVYNGATFLGSVSVSANMNDTADQFIGLSSTDPFDRFILSYSNDNLFRYIDDLQLGTADVAGAVPEPATWAMMLFGFGLVGGAMRRRKQQRSKVRFAL